MHMYKILHKITHIQTFNNLQATYTSFKTYILFILHKYTLHNLQLTNTANNAKYIRAMRITTIFLVFNERNSERFVT